MTAKPDRNRRPLIGVTADIVIGPIPGTERLQVGAAYTQAIEKVGGIPIILPPQPILASDLLALCDGVVLTGGDDPIMTHWGIAMHPKATPVHPERQAFELALLDALDRASDKPVLGVCLGMQLMGLHCGGTLTQHLPDTLATADQHWDRRAHAVESDLGTGIVHSHHRQALSDAGSMRVIARAPDGVIEAIERDDRESMYLGVQWHPERTEDPRLGLALFARLVDEARARRG